jgi:hypothetical protein
LLSIFYHSFSSLCLFIFSPGFCFSNHPQNPTKVPENLKEILPENLKEIDAQNQQTPRPKSNSFPSLRTHAQNQQTQLKSTQISMPKINTPKQRKNRTEQSRYRGKKTSSSIRSGGQRKAGAGPT